MQLTFSIFFSLSPLLVYFQYKNKKAAVKPSKQQFFFKTKQRSKSMSYNNNITSIVEFGESSTPDNNAAIHKSNLELLQKLWPAPPKEQLLSIGKCGTTGKEIKISFQVFGELAIPEQDAAGRNISAVDNNDKSVIILVHGLSCPLYYWDTRFCQLLHANINKDAQNKLKTPRKYTVIRMDNRDIGLSTHMDEVNNQPREVKLWKKNVKSLLRTARLGLPKPLARLLGEPSVYRSEKQRQKNQETEDKNIQYSIKDMADDLVRLLDTLGLQKAHFVGCSMGGMIVQELLINNPERLRSAVLLSTTPLFPFPQVSFMPKLIDGPLERYVDKNYYLSHNGMLRHKIVYKDAQKEASCLYKIRFFKALAGQYNNKPRKNDIRLLYDIPEGESVSNVDFTAENQFRLKEYFPHANNDCDYFPEEELKYAFGIVYDRSSYDSGDVRHQTAVARSHPRDKRLKKIYRQLYPQYYRNRANYASCQWSGYLSELIEDCCKGAVTAAVKTCLLTAKCVRKLAAKTIALQTIKDKKQSENNNNNNEAGEKQPNEHADAGGDNNNNNNNSKAAAEVNDQDGANNNSSTTSIEKQWLEMYKRIPVTVIHGGQDVIIPLSQGQYLSRIIPHSKLVVLPKMGHYFPPCTFPRIAEEILTAADRGEKVYYY